MKSLFQKIFHYTNNKLTIRQFQRKSHQSHYYPVTINNYYSYYSTSCAQKLIHNNKTKIRCWSLGKNFNEGGTLSRFFRRKIHQDNRSSSSLAIISCFSSERGGGGGSGGGGKGGDGSSKFKLALSLSAAAAFIPIVNAHSEDKGKSIQIMSLTDEEDVNSVQKSPENLKNQRKIVIDMEILEKILTEIGDHPVMIVSINGASRTGKSLVLSYLVRHLESISVKNKNGGIFEKIRLTSLFDPPSIPQHFLSSKGDSRQTVGVHIYPQPFFLEGESPGEKIGLILMDCQGLFDGRTSPWGNTLIYTFSSLLSSLMVFNVMGHSMNEKLFEDLQYHSRYVKGVLSGLVPNGRDLSSSSSSTMQKLIILVRDFQWYPEFSFGYHDNQTQPKPFQLSDEVPSYHNYFKRKFYSPLHPKNMATRDEILKNFESTAFFLMPPPGEKFVQKSHPTSNHLSPTFKSELDSFLKNVLANPWLKTKKVGGQEVSGTELKEHLTAWAGILQDPEMVDKNLPQVRETLADMTTLLSNKMRGDKAVKIFYDWCTQFLNDNPQGVDDIVLKKKMEEGTRMAVEYFKNRPKMGRQDLEVRLVQEVMARCEEVGDIFTKLNQINKENEKANRPWWKKLIAFIFNFV